MAEIHGCGVVAPSNPRRGRAVVPSIAWLACFALRSGRPEHAYNTVPPRSGCTLLVSGQTGAKGVGQILVPALSAPSFLLLLCCGRGCVRR
jgi:hypothetical protein